MSNPYTASQGEAEWINTRPKPVIVPMTKEITNQTSQLGNDLHHLLVLGVNLLAARRQLDHPLPQVLAARQD